MIYIAVVPKFVIEARTYENCGSWQKLPECTLFVGFDSRMGFVHDINAASNTIKSTIIWVNMATTVTAYTV